MHILLFSWRDIKNPKAGGSELYFHEISKRWVKNCNKVTWICCAWKGCKKEEIIDGIKILRTGSELSLYLLAPFVYFKLKEKPDIIIDIENGIPFFTPLYAKERKILHIHHVHNDVWFKEASNKNIKEKIIASIGYFLEKKIMPFVYKGQKIITISKSSAEEINNLGFGKIMGVVNPAIEISVSSSIKRTSYPSILFLNRIKKYKGADVLVKAFLRIDNEKEMKNAVLYVCGDGDYLKEIKEFAKINDRIKILGKISEKEKYELMDKCWFFVNPSFKEGWGIVNIEANYFGMPVIGSDVGGIKDSVINNKTGLLFRYGDEKELAERILELVKNKKLRNDLGKNGLKWARSFSWDKASKQYLEILKKN